MRIVARFEQHIQRLQHAFRRGQSCIGDEQRGLVTAGRCAIRRQPGFLGRAQGRQRRIQGKSFDGVSSRLQSTNSCKLAAHYGATPCALAG